LLLQANKKQKRNADKAKRICFMLVKFLVNEDVRTYCGYNRFSEEEGSTVTIKLFYLSQIKKPAKRRRRKLQLFHNCFFEINIKNVPC